MREELDYTTLKWVKTEINESLKQIRQALELFSEDSSDKTQLQFCITYLHQIYGTLHMVEIQGAALLAEEMEKLCAAMLNGDVPVNNEKFDVLIRGTYQLPNYLESLERGLPDIPAVLLPILNDLRSARKKPLLSENAFFSPDLSVFPPANDPDAGSDAQNQAKKLRPVFQAALLSWFKDKTSQDNLVKISRVLTELQKAAQSTHAKRLWWVADGVVEGLIDGGLEPGSSIVSIISQVDKEIKKLIDHGEAAFNSEPPIELIKNCLYYAARSKSGGPRISALKAAYQLDKLLVDDNVLERLADDLKGSNAEIIHNVYVIIKDDLTSIKDRLDVFVRTQNHNVSELEPMAESLQRIADTLAMLGMSDLRKVCQDQAKIIHNMISNNTALSDAALMNIASSLLYVESTLDNLEINPQTRVRHENESPDMSGIHEVTTSQLLLPATEQEQLNFQVIQQARKTLAEVKEAFNQFELDNNLKSELETAPDKLLQIRGALMIMGLERAAKIISSSIVFIRNDVLGASRKPAADKLDTLADAITSIEYFLEAIEEGRGPSLSVLDVAEMSAQQLGYPIATVDSLLNAPRPAPSATPASAVDASAASAQPVAAAPAVSAGTAASDDDEDRAEILEIFLEEATELQDTINTSLRAWAHDNEDKEALVTLRRAFHTVKGSGRLAGATAAGEFAWAVENMLNRVIDGKIVPSADMLTLLEHVKTALDGLLQQLKGITVHAPDTARLVGHLTALANGEQPDISDLNTPPTAQPKPADEAPLISDELVESFSAAAISRSEIPPAAAPADSDEVTAQPPQEVDPVLLDIFRKETATHLASLREFLAGVKNPDTALVTDAVYRALHTLNGSARMANVESIITLSQPMNYLARALLQNKIAFGAHGMQILGEYVDALTQLVEYIDKPGTSLPDYSGLLEAIEGMRASVMTMASQLGMHPQFPSSSQISQLNAATPVEPDFGLATEEYSAADTSQFLDLADIHDLLPEAVATAPENVTTAQQASAAITSQLQHDSAIQSQLIDYDMDLVAVFLEEAEEIQEHIEQALHVWSQNHASIEPVAELQRALHTLKGSARMANVRAIGDLAHAIESLLEKITDHRLGSRQEYPELIQRCHDWFSQALEKVRQNATLTPATALLLELESAARGRRAIDAAASSAAIESTALTPPQLKLVSTADAMPATVTPPVAEAGADATTLTASTTKAQLVAELTAQAQDEIENLNEFIDAFAGETEQEPAEAQPATAAGFEQVRVRSELLNELVNYSGEINIFNSRISQQLNAFRFNLTELEQTVNRLREQLRNFEILTETQMVYRHEPTSSDLDDFDPLEMDRFSNIQHLSRAMVESLGDLTSIQNLLDNLCGESFSILSQQEKVTGELQDGLMHTRMVAFASILPRLRRIVRQTSADTHKKAKLEVTGGEGELDRSQLTRIIPVLEHLLRNAVDHGLEIPQDRTAKGKDPAGTITIDFSHRGSDIVIRISDDGSGINIPAIRNKAIQKGLMDPGTSLPDSEIVQFIFESGFSTADKITQISGRGVGMDVVNTEIKQMSGTIHVESTADRGTTFTIRLPLTLLANQAIMVTANDAIYAIQLTYLDHVVRITPSELADLVSNKHPVFHYAGHQYHFLNLAEILQGIASSAPSENERIPIILLRSGDQYVAIQVDAMLGRQDIVIKSVGPQLSNVSVLSGATILADGRIALILNIENLIRSFIARQKQDAQQVEAIAPDQDEKRSRTVLVVDDSITVRKVTTRLLSRYNYLTLTAKDGLDAINEMEKQIPDVVLLDVEMPRMDGFELAAHMRADNRLRNVPIIMITSRTGDKHRQHALEIGVDKYMGKPYQEKDLLDSIAELVHARPIH